MRASEALVQERPLWRRALSGVPAVSAGGWQRAAPVVRWLIATRAVVFPLTGLSVAFAACLTVPVGLAQWAVLLATATGLVMVHASNNLLNDLVDHRAGLDRDNYFRTQYGVHVLESGLMTQAGLIRYLLITGGIALLAGLAVCLYRDGGIWWFMLLGAFFVLFYTWPLKRMALGEVAVWLTWGPLMVGGTCLAISGTVNMELLLAGLVYGLGPTVVIVAKHTDKAPEDRRRGVTTLPVLMGAAPARIGIVVLAVAQVASAMALALVTERPGLLAVVLATPALWRLIGVCRAPTPASRPEGHPVEAWPLWLTSYAFVYARAAGLWLVGGLLLQNLLAGFSPAAG